MSSLPFGSQMIDNIKIKTNKRRNNVDFSGINQHFNNSALVVHKSAYIGELAFIGWHCIGIMLHMPLQEHTDKQLRHPASNTAAMLLLYFGVLVKQDVELADI